MAAEATLAPPQCFYRPINTGRPVGLSQHTTPAVHRAAAPSTIGTIAAAQRKPAV